MPTGALLLVSHQPMIAEGIKTEESDRLVSQRFAEAHLRIGIETLRRLAHGVPLKGEWA